MAVLEKRTLYTIGYGAWQTKFRMTKMLARLNSHRITTLVDIRQSPCSSGLPPRGSDLYWPRDWHLQAGGRGIEMALSHRGLEYLWLGELGNPQIKDPAMAVLRSHLESGDLRWPVNRGLRLLGDMLTNDSEVVCLMCACALENKCHRSVIARAAASLLPELQLNTKDLSS